MKINEDKVRKEIRFQDFLVVQPDDWNVYVHDVITSCNVVQDGYKGYSSEDSHYLFPFFSLSFSLINMKLSNSWMLVVCHRLEGFGLETR